MKKLLIGFGLIFMVGVLEVSSTYAESPLAAAKSAETAPTKTTAPHYAAGEMIELDSYQPASMTYEIVALKYKGMGPFYVTIEQVAQAIKALNLEKIRRSPHDLVGNQYMLDRDILILADTELAQREAEIKKKSLFH